MTIPSSVKIVEVGPRDGLQNESMSVPVEVKVILIEKLVEAGLSVVESGSFVSPKWVPQMASSAEVYLALKSQPNRQRNSPSYPMLVPNMKGLEAALDVGVEEIAIFAAASETFSEKNINCSIDQSIERYQPVVEKAQSENIIVRGYISCVLGCPYEGAVSKDVVADVAVRLLDLGCYEISLGDTIGIGTAASALAMVERVSKDVPVNQLAAHFHDTYGQALANIYAVLQAGVSVFDSSVAGLGGCPYARGASGNVATEDLLYMLDGMNIETGVDMAKLLAAGEYINQFLGRDSASKAALALVKRNQ
ncbi:MAG: hydroxymethylglutaryl-CoA lyase [Gammaproteobacteria bacterium]|jgi:hydroxymethylglutaryl-CoA lyase